MEGCRKYSARLGVVEVVRANNHAGVLNRKKEKVGVSFGSYRNCRIRTTAKVVVEVVAGKAVHSG